MAFPSLMTGAQVDATDKAARQHEQRHDPDHRKETPDPWPILERALPRIAAKIRKHWGKRALDSYLAKLARRRGLPLDVLGAILELARLHDDHRLKGPTYPWKADRR